MNKFKIEKTGIDLRGVKTKLTDAFFTDPNKKVNFLILDLLSNVDHLIQDFAIKAIIDGSEGIISVDLEDFKNFEDPWEEAYRVFKQWEKSYFNLPFTSLRFMFSNLPENTNPGTYPQGIDLFHGYELGLELTTHVGWLEKIENWKSYFGGKLPQFITRPLCPLNYSLELEKWFELSQIESIGTGWNGGKFNQEIVEEVFGQSYLLAFSALNSTTVVLPVLSDPILEASKQLDFLKELVGEGMDDKELKKFTLKKTVDRLKKGPKKLIYDSFQYKLTPGGKEWIIPTEDSQVLLSFSDTRYSFSPPQAENFPIDMEPTEEDLEWETIISNSLGTDRSKLTDKEAWRVLFMTVVDNLREKYPPEERWEMDFVSFGKYAMGIFLYKIHKKSWFEKYAPDQIDETKDFFLVMNNPSSINFLDLAKVADEIIDKEYGEYKESL